MNPVTQLLETFAGRGAEPALFWRQQRFTFDEILWRVRAWTPVLDAQGIGTGSVVAVVGDFSPGTITLFFALMERGAIIVPLTREATREMETSLAIAGAERLARFDDADQCLFERRAQCTPNPLVAEFRTRQAAGLIVFSSGSTGVPKGILHDCTKLVDRFLDGREGRRTVLFLMMDHLGGFNTLLAAFCQGGGAVCLPSRAPDAVCEAIEESGATLLPTTPTFLNLLIASNAHHGRDLSSVNLITYGTEVMPEETLRKLARVFPNARLKQTYGLSETGTLRSKSQSDNSVWVKVGGDGFDVKVVHDVLWVRAAANMVGYLNAPNPFDAEGWLCTGDRVEVDGEYMRILGRDSDIINVGGQKVFPAEVENVLLQAPGVAEASVFGSRHPLMGSVVNARVSLEADEDRDAAIERLRRHCRERLAKYKVPVRFDIVQAEDQHSARYKKLRQPVG